MDRCPPKLTGSLAAGSRNPCNSAVAAHSSRLATASGTTGPHQSEWWHCAAFAKRNVRSYPESGQTRLRLNCPLSAISGLMHCNMIGVMRTLFLCVVLDF